MVSLHLFAPQLGLWQSQLMLPYDAKAAKSKILVLFWSTKLIKKTIKRVGLEREVGGLAN